MNPLSYLDDIISNPSPLEIETANRTARSAGAVGGRAIVPRYVAEIAREGDDVLNFGAGLPDSQGSYLHSNIIRASGAKVWEYDFGRNTTANKSVMNYAYDIVFASNVLNVQSSATMMRETLTQIFDRVKKGGVAVFNYPDSPRKSDMSALEVADVISNVFNKKPQRVIGFGSASAPLWEVVL